LTKRKLWTVLEACIATVMLVFFAYGIIRYPDGPIHPCPEHGYCGKQGQPHTVQDYDGHMTWQTCLMIGWPLGMLAIFLLKRYKPKA
jgi:hypothetical protein